MDSARIMIVEDNATVAEDCRDCLEGLAYSVTSIVASGEESIARAEVERPDAVLMDIQLRDEMDGIEAAEQIHARFEIPVVFLSANSDRNLLERAKRVGSFGYLLKPFEERELHATLEMALYRAKTEKEHKQMEVRLRQAQKLEGLQLMAGGVAHIFSNKLQGVLSFAEMALEKLPPESDVSTCVRNIKEAAWQAAEISRLMLTYVGQGQGKMKEISLSELVQTVCDHLRSALPAEISLCVALAHEDETVQVIVAELLQLTMNLFANAVEAIGDEVGEITISTRIEAWGDDCLKQMVKQGDLPAGDYAVLEIADTGCGMDDQTQAKAFDPFFTTKFVGRGLGLAAVLGIVHGHNGAITIDSTPGEGTTVKILFPCAGRKKNAPRSVRLNAGRGS